MTETHESIEELLAGYVLRSLSGEDAARVDRLLSDHVPLCPACRDTLAVFQGVTADLALEPRRMTPPDTLLPSLHRDLGVRAAPAPGGGLRGRREHGRRGGVRGARRHAEPSREHDRRHDSTTSPRPWTSRPGPVPP